MESPIHPIPKQNEQPWPGFGIFFPAVIIIQWVFSLTKEWGYLPYRGWGIAISLGLYLGFLIVLFSADYGLARSGVHKPVRSAVWASAFLGPYLGLVTFNAWEHPLWSQIAGTACSLITFVVVYLIDRRKSSSP